MAGLTYFWCRRIKFEHRYVNHTSIARRQYAIVTVLFFAAHSILTGGCVWNKYENNRPVYCAEIFIASLNYLTHILTKVSFKSNDCKSRGLSPLNSITSYRVLDSKQLPLFIARLRTLQYHWYYLLLYQALTALQTQYPWFVKISYELLTTKKRH